MCSQPSWKEQITLHKSVHDYGALCSAISRYAKAPEWLLAIHTHQQCRRALFLTHFCPHLVFSVLCFSSVSEHIQVLFFICILQWLEKSSHIRHVYGPSRHSRS